MTARVDTSPEGRRRHHMEQAITTAREKGGGVLVRRTGGFWTYPGCPVEDFLGAPMPTWNVGDKVITDLITDGLATVETRLTSGTRGPCKVRIKP